MKKWLGIDWIEDEDIQRMREKEEMEWKRQQFWKKLGIDYIG